MPTTISHAIVTPKGNGYIARPRDTSTMGLLQFREACRLFEAFSKDWRITEVAPSRTAVIWESVVLKPKPGPAPRTRRN